MEVMGVTIGNEAKNFAQIRDDRRIAIAEKFTTDTSKKERIKRKEARLAENDAYEEADGLLYGPGIAD